MLQWSLLKIKSVIGEKTRMGGLDSFYSSLTICNRQVMWRKELNKKKGSYPLLPMKEDQTN